MAMIHRMSARVRASVSRLGVPVFPLIVLSGLVACGGGGTTEPVQPPATTALSRVTLASVAEPTVIIGQALTLTVRGESSTGVPILGATVTARSTASALTVGSTTDGTVTSTGSRCSPRASPWRTSIT